MNFIQFTVPGKPATAGSKKAFPIKRRDGSTGVAVTHDNSRFRPWAALVRDAALKETDGAMFEGPVMLIISIGLGRPKGHYRAAKGHEREVKASAPEIPTVKPDSTKVLRALEDALTEVVWYDDKQVAFHVVKKDYTRAPGVQVTICDLTMDLSDVVFCMTLLEAKRAQLDFTSPDEPSSAPRPQPPASCPEHVESSPRHQGSDSAVLEGCDTRD